MAALPPAPWTNHRDVAETIGQAAADAIASKLGAHVDLGKASSCDTDEMLVGRPLPLRATVVHFGRPLRDVMILISSLKDDAVRPLAETAGRAAATALGIEEGFDDRGVIGEVRVDEAVEYATLEEALEQCDALYLEAHYTIDLPLGELQLVLGTGLLEAATAFVNGVQLDEEEAPAEAGVSPRQDPELIVDPATAGASDDRIELGTMAPVAGSGELVTDAATDTGAQSLESFDAMLAQQEATDQVASAAGGDAGAPQETDARRWTQLLSGVEVELSAELGRADLALRDITTLAADSVLTLDQLVDEPVTVYVNGTAYATARLVVVDGEYGIEILEVVNQAGLVQAIAA